MAIDLSEALLSGRAGCPECDGGDGIINIGKSHIELTEQELGKVSGGRKGNTPVEYIKLPMKEVLIS